MIDMYRRKVYHHRMYIKMYPCISGICLSLCILVYQASAACLLHTMGHCLLPFPVSSPCPHLHHEYRYKIYGFTNCSDAEEWVFDSHWYQLICFYDLYWCWPGNLFTVCVDIEEEAKERIIQSWAEGVTKLLLDQTEHKHDHIRFRSSNTNTDISNSNILMWIWEGLRCCRK